MKVIVSDPISDDGLKIFYDNNIEVIDATDSTIDENYEHIPCLLYTSDAADD